MWPREGSGWWFMAVRQRQWIFLIFIWVRNLWWEHFKGYFERSSLQKRSKGAQTNVRSLPKNANGIVPGGRKYCFSMSQIISHLNVQERLWSSEKCVPAIFDKMKDDGFTLVSGFNEFLQSTLVVNETFKYWCIYCEMVDILLDCIRAKIDFITVSRMFPYLLLHNTINYVKIYVLYVIQNMAHSPLELKTHSWKVSFQ